MRALVALGFLTVLLAVAAAGADENKKPANLPAAARKAVADAEAETGKARKKFQAEARAIRAKLIARLQQELEAETKKGNLNAALAIRDEIERLRRPNPEIDGEDAALAAARKVLVGGKWRLTVVGTPYRAEWEFHDDGSITNSDRSSQDTRWTIETQGKRKVLKVGVAAFPLPLNAKRLVGVKNTNERVELVRLTRK